MSKEIEAQSQRVIVASDMTCTVSFHGDRPYTSQDLQNLIAQLDMQRALMDGENFSAKTHVTSAPATERRTVPVPRTPKSDIPVLPAKSSGRKVDDGLTIPTAGQGKQRGIAGVFKGAMSVFPTGNPNAPAPYTPTPEELARTIDDLDKERIA